MKRLKDISWLVNEATYRADDSLSYSNLSTYNREGFSKLDGLFDEISGPWLTFGNMVDTLLTSNIDIYNNKFAVAEFPVLTESRLAVVEELFNRHSSSYPKIDLIPESHILKVINELEFQTNWKDDTRIKNILKNGIEYYDLKYQTRGKEIVTLEDHQDAVKCSEKLKNSPTTGWFFTPEPFEEGLDREYQLKFKGKYKGINIRCMADLIIVDHKNKKIYPCDVKTTSYPEWEFAKSFVKWNYYIQAQLYWYIIRQNLDNDPYFKDFELTNFIFIVISRNTLTPLVWEYSDTKAEVDCYYGKNKDIHCRNWRSILEELHYYLTKSPSVPLGIHLEQPNKIVEHLNESL